MKTLYRVRHPAAPDLFVWLAGTKTEDGSFERGLVRYPSFHGTGATLTVVFSELHSGYPKKEAEALAKFVGGTVEKINLPKRKSKSIK